MTGDLGDRINPETFRGQMYTAFRVADFLSEVIWEAKLE